MTKTNWCIVIHTTWHSANQMLRFWLGLIWKKISVGFTDLLTFQEQLETWKWVLGKLFRGLWVSVKNVFTRMQLLANKDEFVFVFNHVEPPKIHYKNPKKAHNSDFAICVAISERPSVLNAFEVLSHHFKFTRITGKSNCKTANINHQIPMTMKSTTVLS